MSSRLPVLAALLASPVFAAAADYCIGGTVVNGLTGEPLHRAAVSIPQSAALADAAGAFRFCGLATGTYYANAEKPGFAPSGVRVAVGPSREDVILRLQPLSAVKGRVVDDKGEPLENVLIQLLSITTENGRRKVKVETAVSTDDRGAYRLPGLATGKYLLRAAGWQGSSSAKPSDGARNFAPIYYGGGNDLASASPLWVQAGQDVDADFSVTLDPAWRVRGTLSGAAPNLAVKIDLLGTEGDLNAAPVTYHAATGAFEIAGVAPGSYTLRATEGEGDERRRGEQAIEVGAGDVNDVTLPLAGPAVLKGTVRVASASATAPIAPHCAIELAPAGVSMSEDSPLEFSTGEEGEFELGGVLPGRYRLRMDCATGYLSSARAGDADLMARDELVVSPGAAPPPLDALLNTDGGTVDVSAAQEGDGEPPSAWLVLAPNDGNELHFRFAILKGKTSLSGVAPGDYQVYAWTGSPYAFEYANPAARQAWAGRAASVHVAEREHGSVTVKVLAGEAP